ncbi:antibiotic biosynthesis monooxygenase [Malaciobacter molluscorum LMG 25693]|uniref:Antibiotic biosynthesis monooxygenase n=1 Tax=Malaciobacter molluscorum LMG 25693 TaxID=870501 RepID=A0A2G1DGT6_9BACT|nr:putative quinol monooxygenase [Malaciobacter molluscorum]AXX92296.1 putative quinol monooxygenase [Malaciobacter molluscorum LMG 25693]PHO17719.1 antibiotic biosynthesis monooxygenase [Malaciobacter molluscorum LMG 25693]RXJ93542.1 antibiotic biosynthesis monooxygenase [Malaciobacter molluscorum]
MNNIIVVAKIKVKKEYNQEIYKVLETLHEQTHKNDDGCIQYDLHKNLEEENSYTFIETWENEDFLNKHSNKEHFKSFVSSIENKVEHLDIQKLEKIK